MQLTPYPNTIMQRKEGVRVDLAAALRDCPATWSSRRKTRLKTRFLRTASAKEAIADFEHDTRIFGFTKGQFSLIDLIEATIEHTGPVHISVSTWAAATADTSDLLDLLHDDRLLSVRFLVDPSLFRRKPEVAKTIVANFGKESIRVANNHAKLFLASNDDWKVTCHTSMNLNRNDRFEDFNLEENHELFDFNHDLFDRIWNVRKELFKGRKEDWFNEF